MRRDPTTQTGHMRTFSPKREKLVTVRPMTEAAVTTIFTYQPPGAADIPKYNELRETARAFALAVLRTTPTCADQSVAIRKIREAVAFANAAVALKGAV